MFLLLRNRLNFRSLLDKYLYYLVVSWQYDSYIITTTESTYW